MQTQAQLPSQKENRKRRRGAVTLGMLTILAIAGVVVFVSVPRLRSFALNENESDARFIVKLLAGQLSQLPQQADSLLGPRIESLSLSPSVEQALSDGEFLEDGLLFRRHGFLFRILRVDAATGTPKTEPGTALAGGHSVFAVQAWPWRHGRTGSAALLGTDDGLLFRHENRMATWNGPLQQKRDLGSWNGWRLLP